MKGPPSLEPSEAFEEPKKTTRDHFLLGGVELEQPARGHGYRVNVDAFLLADFAVPRSSRDRLWDLGAGVGAIGITLARRGATRVVLVERTIWASQLAEGNVEANGLKGRVTVLASSVLDAARAHAGEADLVVSNPPYFIPGSTRPSPTKEIADARSGDVAEFVQAARLLLARRGRACFVYPASELVSLSHTLRTVGLEPKRLQFVHPKSDLPARVVLIEAQAAKAGGLKVEPSLVEKPATTNERE